MKKLLYILISTSSMLLFGSKHDLEYTKDTCNRTYWTPSLSTNGDRAGYRECHYSRFELYDKTAKKYVAHIAYNPSECFIQYLRVDDEYKRQGIGKELAQKALEDLIKQGCQEVRLSSSREGEPFWEKLGAKPDRYQHVFSNLQPNLPEES